MSKEAMKLALEALEYIHNGANNQGPHTGISWRCVLNKAEPTITALREALAKPDFWEGYVPEPVKPAQQKPDINEELTIAYMAGVERGKELAQPTWVGLEQKDMPGGDDPLFDDPKFLAGMVYAANKLMEKNR